MPTQRKTAPTAKKSSAKSSKSAAKKSSAKSATQTRASAGKRGSASQSRSSARSGSANSGGPRRNRTPNALELLTEDHRQVQKMFRKAERMESGDAQLQELVQTACAALTLHAQIEEELLYPALREQGDNEDLVEEATVEHDVAKQLIAQLESMGGDDERYKATFKVLGEYVNHHVEEEESQIFRAAKRAKLDLAAMGEQIMTRKQGAAEGDTAGSDGAQRKGGSAGRGSTSGAARKPAKSAVDSRSSATGDDGDDNAMATGSTGGDNAEDTERPGRGGRSLFASSDSGDDTEIDIEVPTSRGDRSRRQAH